MRNTDSTNTYNFEMFGVVTPNAASVGRIVSNVKRNPTPEKVAGFFAFRNKRTSSGVSRTPEMRRFRIGRFLHNQKWAEGFTNSAYRPCIDGSGVLKRDDRETPNATTAK